MKHQHSEYFIDMLINKIADLEKKVHDLETELLFTPKVEEKPTEELEPSLFRPLVLKQYRENAGWSLREMAEKLDIDYSYLAKLEKDRVPSIKMAHKIAKLFNADIREFMV